MQNTRAQISGQDPVGDPATQAASPPPQKATPVTARSLLAHPPGVWSAQAPGRAIDVLAFRAAGWAVLCPIHVLITDGGFLKDGTFRHMLYWDTDKLEELFRARSFVSC